MNYALVENGVVTNIIWLYPGNEKDFPNAVQMNDIPAGIGDTYDGADFYHNGEKVLTSLEIEQRTVAELDQALLEAQYQSIIGGLE